MKKIISEENKRMQKLAGIICENIDIARNNLINKYISITGIVIGSGWSYATQQTIKVSNVEDMEGEYRIIGTNNDGIELLITLDNSEALYKLISEGGLSDDKNGNNNITIYDFKI
jgi:hypothetical protein